MTTEEFGKKYLNEDTLEIFDETCDFFSKELPQEFIENYDVGEVILETKGHQETAKNIDNVLKFTAILQDKQPQLYKEYFEYFDDFLIDYYCFKQDYPNAGKAFERFMENPLQSYDMYLLGFKKMLFHQQSDLIEQAILKNYDAVNASEDLIASAVFELVICKFYIDLQKVYEKNENTLNKEEFSTKLADYNLNLDDNYLSPLEKGVLKPKIEAAELNALFKKEKKSAIVIIQGYFLRDMYKRGFAFYLSGKIWDKMLNYWQRNNSSQKTSDAYFKVQTDLFEEYISGFSGMFLDNKPEMNAVLWGSVYLFDFLYKYNIISEKAFLDFMETSKELKGKVIGQYTPDLWNSNFIHTWEKPDCISETEFVEESKIFEKSISFEYQKFTRLRSGIAEELSKIGELSHFIIEGGKNNQEANDTNLLDDFFSMPEKEIPKGTNFNSNITDPIKVEEKVGRNEPCPCGSGKKYKKCCLRK